MKKYSLVGVLVLIIFLLSGCGNIPPSATTVTATQPSGPTQEEFDAIQAKLAAAENSSDDYQKLYIDISDKYSIQSGQILQLTEQVTGLNSYANELKEKLDVALSQASVNSSARNLIVPPALLGWDASYFDVSMGISQYLDFEVESVSGDYITFVGRSVPLYVRSEWLYLDGVLVESAWKDKIHAGDKISFNLTWNRQMTEKSLGFPPFFISQIWKDKMVQPIIIFDNP